jgi:tRNA(Ile)-lysidine synthase
MSSDDEGVNVGSSMLIEAIERFLASHGIPPSHFLVAASGGVDSTALLVAIAELRDRGFPLTAAHINHHLRGDESDGDQQYVRQLCRSLGVPLQVGDAPLDDDAVRARGVEAAARSVRRELLEEIRVRVAADFILTAHQQNDQAETLLMRLLTGSGLLRLGAIRPVTEDRYLRPLLGVSREAIESFLASRAIEPRRDSSNADRRFLRNRIRHELLPLLREYNPQVVPTIAATALDAQDLRELVLRFVDAAGSAVVREPAQSRFEQPILEGNAWILGTLLHDEIRRLDPEARNVGASDIRRLAESRGRPARISVTRNLEAVVTADSLVLRRRSLPQPAAPFELRLTAGAAARLPDGTTLSVVGTVDAGPVEAQRDRALCLSGRCRQLFQLPSGGAPDFVVRTRRAGERIRPLGLAHEKKLKSLFIDRKIPRDIRDSIPLLFWQDRIVWVAGVTLADDFKVTGFPGDVYEVKLERP